MESAGILGNPKGTAAGMAPKAHLGIYKVCYKTWKGSDIPADIDQAITDGVDILSMSIGAHPDHYFDHSLAIGTIVTVKNNIFASSSAGNGGTY